MSSSNNKRTHQSTNSNGSTYPLPSLCSSLSSHSNYSSKSTVLNKKTDDNDISRQLPNNKPTLRKQQRWDESQFAIELCDDTNQNNQHIYKSASSLSSSNRRKKLILSKLFHYHTHTTTHNDTSIQDTRHNSSNSSNSSTHSSNHSQISVKFTSLLRKIKSMKSL